MMTLTILVPLDKLHCKLKGLKMAMPLKSSFRHASSLILGSMLGICTSTISAMDLQTGINAYYQGNYTRAFNVFLHEAHKGNITAKHLLGVLYQSGKGVERDPDAGFQWCLAAAKEGVLEAQFQVGLMYLQGEGVKENEEEAINWLLEAANKGYPQASEVLQFVFSDDFGVGC